MLYDGYLLLRQIFTGDTSNYIVKYMLKHAIIKILTKYIPALLHKIISVLL